MNLIFVDYQIPLSTLINTELGGSLIICSSLSAHLLGNFPISQYKRGLETMGDKDTPIKKEFDVEEASRRLYQKLIDDLRSLLAGDRTVRDRPVLPSAAEIPRDHPRFEVVIRTNSNEVTFLFRRQDLYLEAYQRGGSNIWYEFKEKNQVVHAVKDSTFLDFSGSYSGSHGLEENAAYRDSSGKPKKGTGDRDRIPLGRYALRDAVNALATSDVQNVIARALIVIIEMISESLRFEDIEFFILANWYTGAIPTSELVVLENNWGDFSNGLLRSYAHPDLSIFPIRLVYDGEQHIFTFEMVVALIALLAHNVNGIPKPRSTRSVNDDIDEYAGRALLEVFEVIVNDIDGESPGDLYGKITVTDGLLSQYIYNQDRDHSESVYPNEKATLTGPTQSCVSALDNIIIDVDLMDKDQDLSPDDQVSKGEISWSVYDIHTNAYNKPLVETIYGTYGSVSVVYAVFSDAVQAFVEVTMINGDDEDPADVYGGIFASNSHPNFQGKESVLFHRERNDVVEVKEGAKIPLSRSIVAVPLDSQLVIRADLVDRDTTIFNPDDEIAKGTRSFPAKLSGDVYGYINGQYGQIKIKVTWNP
ncbi:uncharacterized protein LOC108226993 [Daucus carota subsp. sativus]